MQRKVQIATIIVATGAVLGLLFASVSTSDFAMHLDRQVHDVHCSFTPGLGGPEAGESGCQVTMVSPYSSVFRATVWGGVPVSLAAMAVFAFLLFFAAELWLTGRQNDVRATGFLALATALPALTSMIMAYLSFVELDAVCKLCIGIYLSSAISFVGGVALFLRARKLAAAGGPPIDQPIAAAEPERDVGSNPTPAWVSAVSTPDEAGDGDVVELTHRKPAPRPSSAPLPAPVSWAYLAAVFGVGGLFVAVLTVSYVAAAPDHGRFIGVCGGLTASEDEYGVMVDLDRHPGTVPAIEILDPLCPACRGFEKALSQSGLDTQMDRRALLFPLDNTCNWMVDTTIHPGACTVSYAMLCAEAKSGEVLEWAFANQDQIRESSAVDPKAAARLVGERFPELTECIGSAKVKSSLNRSLRWAVSNGIPVLTPQLYVGGVKLCDDDVDLGLEFALPRMLSAYRAGTLKVTGGEFAPADDIPGDDPPANKSNKAPGTKKKPKSPAPPATRDEPGAGHDDEPEAAAKPDGNAQPGGKADVDTTAPPEPDVVPEPAPAAPPAPPAEDSP